MWHVLNRTIHTTYVKLVQFFIAIKHHKILSYKVTVIKKISTLLDTTAISEGTVQHLQNKIDKTTYQDILTTIQAQINHTHLIHSESNLQRAYIREKNIVKARYDDSVNTTTRSIHKRGLYIERDIV